MSLGKIPIIENALQGKSADRNIVCADITLSEEVIFCVFLLLPHPQVKREKQTPSGSIKFVLRQKESEPKNL